VVSPTQPFPKTPILIGDQISPETAWGITPWDRGKCADEIASLRFDGMYTPPSIQGTIMYPGNAGGPNWGGVSIDPTRGVLFVSPGTEVYEGMIVGEHSRASDLDVNVTREKKLTNIRAAGRDENVVLSPPRALTIDTALEFIDQDELVEITPDAIRVRKRILECNRRPKRQAAE